MNGINKIGYSTLNQQELIKSIDKNNVNFKAATNVKKQNEEDAFIRDYEKQKKNAQRDKNISMGLSVFMAATFALIAGLALHQSGIFGKKVQQAIAKDLTKEKTLKELSLGKELEEQTEEIKLLIERRNIFKEKGIETMSPIFLYSEPGAGKNAWTYALAKDLKAKLYEVNVLKFNDMYHGQSENNILKYIENVAKDAKKNPNQLHIVYFDEIDSVAMKDNSVNRELTNKLHNAFKTGFNQLLKIPNVQIIGSSNKASKGEEITKLLDDAIMNRWGKKIFIPLPNSKQLQNCVESALGKIKKEQYIDTSLLKDNPAVKQICDYLSQDGHHISFRDMEDIIIKTVTLSEKEGKGAKITFAHFKDAALDKANQLNWPPEEIEAFKAALG